jgi:hypothetical protein
MIPQALVKLENAMLDNMRHETRKRPAIIISDCPYGSPDAIA